MKNKLFIPRKLSDDDSRYSDWNNKQPMVDGKRINQYDLEGMKQGEWWYYNEDDGSLSYKGSYVNGKREGYWEFYHENGTGMVVYKGSYVNGIKEGVWEWYHPDGEFWHKELYKNGRTIKKYEK
jgi:antitoxin component YwqK of YwqJK toxin-antitoxin module